MSKKSVTYRLDSELVERVKERAGPRGATKFVERALLDAVERDVSGGGLNSPPERPARPAEPRRWESSESVWKEKPLLAERLRRFGK